jgi:hypothetical protein
LVKELCEDAFDSIGRKRTFYLTLDKKYKEVVASIKKFEKHDIKFVNKIDQVCRLKKKHF